MRPELLRRRPHHLIPIPAKLLLQPRHRNRLRNSLAQRIHHRRRRPRRCQYPVPAVHHEAGHAFGDGRHVGQQRRAAFSGDRDGLQLACLHLRQRRGDAVEHQRDLAAQQGHDRGAAAFVGNVHHVGARLVLEHLGRQMAGVAVAGRCETELARMALAIGDQFGNGVGGRAQRRGDQHGQGGDERYRREVLARVVGQRGIQAGVDGVRRQHHQQRVAVGLGARELGGGDRAARARLVFQHHRLAPLLLQFGAQRAGQHVGAAAGRIRNQQGDGLVGVGGRGVRRPQAEHARREGCQDRTDHRKLLCPERAQDLSRSGERPRHPARWCAACSGNAAARRSPSAGKLR
ncbi:hypothetical protein D3C86_1350910 [compost metagenome]